MSRHTSFAPDPGIPIFESKINNRSDCRRNLNRVGSRFTIHQTGTLFIETGFFRVLRSMPFDGSILIHPNTDRDRARR